MRTLRGQLGQHPKMRLEMSLSLPHFDGDQPRFEDRLILQACGIDSLVERVTRPDRKAGQASDTTISSWVSEGVQCQLRLPLQTVPHQPQLFAARSLSGHCSLGPYYRSLRQTVSCRFALRPGEG